MSLSNSRELLKYVYNNFCSVATAEGINIKNITPSDIEKALSIVSLPVFMQKRLQLDLNWHHNDWARIYNLYDRGCIEAARDHSKSWFWSYALPFWECYRKENFSVCLISYSQEQTKERLRLIIDTIASKPEFAYLRPKEEEMWGSLGIKFSNGSYIVGKGFNSSLRGGHYKLVIVDDPLKDRQSMSFAEQIRIFRNVISNMVVPGGKLFVIGTHLSKEDLFSELKKNKRYFYKEYPAENGTTLDGRSYRILWKDRYSEMQLKDKQDEIGAISYAVEWLLNDDIDLSVGIFKPQFFRFYDSIPTNLRVYSAWDLAISTDAKKSSSYTAKVTIGIEPNSKDIYVLSTYRDKLDMAEQEKAIKRHYAEDNPIMIGIEGVQYQALFVKEMQKTDLPIKKMMPSGSKLDRAMRYAVLLENGKVFFNKNQYELLLELAAFGDNKKYTYDLVDAFCYALELGGIGKGIRFKDLVALNQGFFYDSKGTNINAPVMSRANNNGLEVLAWRMLEKLGDAKREDWAKPNKFNFRQLEDAIMGE